MKTHHQNNTKVLQSNRPLRKQSGFSLIEVLIAAMILSIALLGILGMQIIGMKGTHHSYMKQQAMGIVQNIMERMAANRSAVLSGDYVFDSSSSSFCSTALPSCETTSCSSTDIASIDKLNIVCGYKKGSGSRTGGVKIENATDIVALAGGKLKVDCRPVGNCALGDVTVRVDWSERALGDETPPQSDFLVLNLRISRP